MNVVTLPLMLLLTTTASALCQTAETPQEAPQDNQTIVGPEENSEDHECLGQEASAFYTCLEQDLVDASYFASGGGISLSDAPVIPDDTPADENTEAEDPAENELVADSLATNPTAYIDTALLWTEQAAGDRNNNGLLEIPVCWINPSEGDRQGRELTQQAVRSTWEVHAPVRFVGWTRCQQGSTGEVRIRISGEGPRSYVGRSAAGRETSMWLNFSFNSWSTDCRNRQGQINWNNCVHSIAVHEFGHLLGYLHEHDRLFHGVAFHMLPADQLQRQIGACRRLNVTGPSRVPVSRPLLSSYDPSSVMNYCFNIYDHQVRLSPLDVAAIQTAYQP